MKARPRISDAQRRARLARRHALAPEHRVADPVAATRAMTVLHATEPASVHLAVAARTDGVTIVDVDAALFRDRTLIKQLAMRRTLFAFPRDLLPAAWGSASARVAAAERSRVAKAVERAGLASDGRAWFEQRCDDVLALLAQSAEGLSTKEIRALVPELDVKVHTTASGAERGLAQVQITPWVLTQLGLVASAVRGAPEGTWRNPRPRWTTMTAWLGDTEAALAADAGYAELISRYLRTFGPATEIDMVWWLGATRTAVRTALATLAAVEVELDDGTTGYVHPDDVDDEPEPAAWAALLPTLDPTVMGWKQRDFYLDPGDVAYLFDTNGNGGTTAWWNGRVVGCWVHACDGRVQPLLRTDVDRAGRRALATEAERLNEFMAGDVVSSVYASPMQRAATPR